MKRNLFSACIVCLLSCGSKHPGTLFKLLENSSTQIHFNNTIVENDSLNPIDMEILYNGGGVAVGDFNNDSLPDLYFTASMTSNKLYLNQGGLQFKDITDKAAVTGNGEWSNAATVVDINNDGWQDIYVCTSFYQDQLKRRNLLYINMGNGVDGIPVFKESAAEYGLADTSYSVQAAFADFDNDGDLDMYLVTTNLARRQGVRIINNRDNSRIDVDKLFKNNWSDSLQHPVFTDVSALSGIVEKGYGLSVSVADINNDGWKDIYVANDFYGSDALYINNRNGTFTNKAKTCFKHTSQNAMGSDIGDINNDGLADIISVDMNPEDNFRKKKNMNSANYYAYQSMMSENIILQYVRNTLQINQGPRMNNNDSVGDPLFAEIGFLAGISQTDWSWSPLIADFDNDGNRDILITNGYPRDVTDHDFAAFRNQSSGIASKKQLLQQIPEIKIPNYAFRNTGDLKFRNTTAEWGMTIPSFSNGAVYVDLDRDGDLDYVVNNINQEAFIYENTLNNSKEKHPGFLNISFKGDSANRNGVGVYAEIYYNKGHMQVMENSGTHGYLSCTDLTLHFGLDTIHVLDSVVIRWPWINKKQILKNIMAGNLIASISQADEPDSWPVVATNKTAVFSEITNDANIKYVHREEDFIDFNKERLLPHKLSQYGPALAIGDINRDGLDDIFIGGNSIAPGQFLLQTASGKFIEKPMPVIKGSISENMGVLLFDADNDGDPDLYCTSGSNEFAAGSDNYQDKFYRNDGKGNFTIDTSAIPRNLTSKSCIKAADYDNDGDLDLFIGGRVEPGKYPAPVSSFLYRNDTKNGIIKFTDVTTTAAKSLVNAGMVCDAVWTDFDNDNFIDLVVTGEWMPVEFLKNKGDGTFEDISTSTGIGHNSGWYNSITAGDFDNDGDIDYIAGNTGENSFYQPSEVHPISIYAKDFDGKGSTDIITTVYIKDINGQLKEFPSSNRDELVEQVPSLKKKFLTYKSFGGAGIGQLFSPDDLRSALSLKATNFKSLYIQNNGNGKFKAISLPVEAQFGPVYGIVADDFNGDGNLDILLCGNDYGTEVTNGRYDALNGLLLTGNGRGKFRSLSMVQSGFAATGDAKALVKLRGANKKYLIAVSQNRGPLKLYSCRKAPECIAFKGNEKSAMVHLANGQTQKVERYCGNSFLSQSGDFILRPPGAKKIDFYNGSAITRAVE